MVANFWFATIGIVSNDAGDGNENDKKAIAYISKTTTVHVHHSFFLYISKPSLHDCDVKLPNFTHPLYEVCEHNAKIFFFFF